MSHPLEALKQARGVSAAPHYLTVAELQKRLELPLAPCRTCGSPIWLLLQSGLWQCPDCNPATMAGWVLGSRLPPSVAYVVAVGDGADGAGGAGGAPGRAIVLDLELNPVQPDVAAAGQQGDLAGTQAATDRAEADAAFLTGPLAGLTIDAVVDSAQPEGQRLLWLRPGTPAARRAELEAITQEEYWRPRKYTEPKRQFVGTRNRLA